MRTIRAAILVTVAAAFPGLAFAGSNCKEPKTGTKAVPIFSPPLSEDVIGAGRLQFFSAPDSRCPMKGIFVVPGDHVVTYAQSEKGWSSVIYSNPKTGNSVSGWVKSARLKQTGAVGPKQ